MVSSGDETIRLWSSVISGGMAEGATLDSGQPVRKPLSTQLGDIGGLTRMMGMKTKQVRTCLQEEGLGDP